RRAPAVRGRPLCQPAAPPRPAGSAAASATSGSTTAPGCAGNVISSAPASGSLTSGNTASPTNNTGVVSGAALNQVPLSAVAHFRKGDAPLLVNHQGPVPPPTAPHNPKPRPP